MTVTRGSTNTNDRGSSYDRRARKNWLLSTCDLDLPETQCRCVYCAKILVYETLTVDRIVPGARGGTYRRDNIQPACNACNIAQGIILREEIHAETCRGSCRRCRIVSEYRAARHAAELARERMTGGYDTETAEYGALITFRDFLIAYASN